MFSNSITKILIDNKKFFKELTTNKSHELNLKFIESVKTKIKQTSMYRAQNYIFLT